MLGIIGGTSLLFAGLPDLEKKRIHTPFGPAEVYCGEFALILRHQYGLPPHRINYTACMAALAIIGVDRVISVGSAGSLHREIRPGTLLIPSDYISVAKIPSIHDHSIDHVRPTIDEPVAADLARIIPEAQKGGIYVQTRGPRIETAAEVRALAQFADIVGMTVASEATLAHELDLRFAALCTVDNYAHGLEKEPLSYEQILETSKKFTKRTEDVMHRIVENLA
jgi:5'-methylthioadenosine phosphorylase